ncbi:oxidoreductase ucpA [Cordyceps fumosorosea ARSEF 2679]|uniref:Oxidoreductase ucpA n=1 Tax=Cordyceps fumosorosea (strain ARSEF 2679) TaxID=1081104 RepID=A0A167LY22_CORFA|nr:oxidoreductase ucpA [Cordyceps fumosorosea ARSEF 2679]OAA53666.1 oxidoreductase ucpA [Cordyceps fumosorosea ARSEF 2679]
MLHLTGKIAIVIGLGQTESDSDPDCWSIGAACAVQLARQGAIIFGGNRTVSSTLKTQKTIQDLGGQCRVQATDATSSDSVKALVDACLARHGRIDILIANVGYSQPGNAATMTEDVWDAQINVNLKTAYLACHHVLPVMEAQPAGGAIVCVSSIAGLRYIGKDQVAYNAAKAGLMQLVKATAVSFAGRGVRVNSVVPGLVETPYTRTMAERYPPPGGGGYEELRRLRDAQVPTGRMGTAWDVANATAFLVSDEAKYITGQELVVDGGITSSTGRT